MRQSLLYCRVPDGEGEWQKCESTFGTSNIPFACGNGVLDEGEACDGTLLGDATCSSVASIFNGGELGCSSDCQFVVETCTSDAPCDSGAVVLNEVCHKNSACGVDGVTSGDWLEPTILPTRPQRCSAVIFRSSTKAFNSVGSSSAPLLSSKVHPPHPAHSGWSPIMGHCLRRAKTRV